MAVLLLQSTWIIQAEGSLSFILKPKGDALKAPPNGTDRSVKKCIASERMIRDAKDRPILRAALNVGADLFLTGDKDFLESSICDPRIISVRDFLLK